MVNINKIKDLCKNHGIKQVYLCDMLGLQKVYLNDVAKGKSSMSDERIRKIADLLGTTYEYLTDQTDDPRPLSAMLAEQAEDDNERLCHLLMNKLPEMSGEAETAMGKLLSLPHEDFERVIKAMGALIG